MKIIQFEIHRSVIKKLEYGNTEKVGCMAYHLPFQKTFDYRIAATTLGVFSNIYDKYLKIILVAIDHHVHFGQMGEDPIAFFVSFQNLLLYEI